MRCSPLFAPDGMRVSGDPAEHLGDAPTVRRDQEKPVRALMDVVIAHERDDDGLVHSHDWAVRSGGAGKRVPTSRYFAAPPVAHTQAVMTPTDPVRRPMDVVPPHDRHDDGLVHSHGWAVSAR